LILLTETCADGLRPQRLHFSAEAFQARAILPPGFAVLIQTGAPALRAFPAEVDAGSAWETRQNKGLERFQPKWTPVRRGKRVKTKAWSVFMFPCNMKTLQT
jgi:hypothetical protein